jgi:hypothetical protein
MRVCVMSWYREVVKRRNIIWKLALLFTMLPVLVGLGCQFNPWSHPNITKLELPRGNPNSYAFNTPLDRVRTALKSDAIRCCGIAIEFSDEVLFSKGVLDRPGNENDAYIRNFHSPIGPSPIYFANGKPLQYLCEFHLHIERKSPTLTQITVIPYHSEVIAGLSPLGLHGSPANIYVTVSPTTVEEYRLLLELGKAIGEQGMPDIILPAPSPKTK